LVPSRPKARAKGDIHESLWPKTFVADSNLRALVNEVRAAIGDDARRPRFVRTVYGFGYAFSAEARDASAGRAVGTIHRLAWRGEQIDLAEGVTVLGRDT